MILMNAYEVKDAAIICSVSERTIQRWAASGKLKARRSNIERSNPRQWIIMDDDLTEFLNRYPQYRGE